MKIMIAVPCLDKVDTEFMRSLVELEKPGEVIHRFISCSLVYKSRNDLAMMALTEKTDYVLWLDSDMVFPPETLKDMLRSIEGRDMLAGVCHMRVPPYRPVLYKKLRMGLTPDENESEVLTEIPEGEPFEVEGCGFGCVLIRTGLIRDVFTHYRDLFGPLPGYGEDVSFCLRARKMGYKIWCNPKIQIGHRGNLVVTGETYGAWKKIHPEAGADE